MLRAICDLSAIGQESYEDAQMKMLLLIAAAKAAGQDSVEARQIWRRDRRNHESPNSAQCEAAMAGALGVELGGPARYGGVLHDRRTIGDDKREIEPEDIRRACRMEQTGSVLCLLLLCGARLLIQVLL